MSVEGKIYPMFQGGAKRIVAIAATAGNVVTNLTPAGGAFKSKRWIVLRGNVIIVTDATVANRLIVLALTDGTNVLETLGYSGANIVASKTGKVDFGEVDSVSGWNRGPMAGDVVGYFSFKQMILEGSDQIRVTINNGVVGDSYSGFVEVLESVI